MLAYLISHLGSLEEAEEGKERAIFGLASFPGLPCFVLQFVLIIYTWKWKSSEKWDWEKPGLIHHMNGCEVDLGELGKGGGGEG